MQNSVITILMEPPHPTDPGTKKEIQKIIEIIKKEV